MSVATRPDVAPGVLVVAAAIYLSTHAKNHVTGPVIPVDGGLSTTLGIQI
jgi:hypothetical protein